MSRLDKLKMLHGGKLREKYLSTEWTEVTIGLGFKMCVSERKEAIVTNWNLLAIFGNWLIYTNDTKKRFIGHSKDIIVENYIKTDDYMAVSIIKDDAIKVLLLNRSGCIQSRKIGNTDEYIIKDIFEKSLYFKSLNSNIDKEIRIESGKLAIRKIRVNR